jgi:hypothetical protein
MELYYRVYYIPPLSKKSKLVLLLPFIERTISAFISVYSIVDA